MKTTIKLNKEKSLSIAPSKTGGGAVILDMTEFCNGINVGGWTLSLNQDQAGALIFALEQAAEAAHIAQDRASAAA